MRVTKKEKNVAKTVYIPQPLIDAAEKRAKRNNKTFSAFVRDALITQLAALAEVDKARRNNRPKDPNQKQAE